MLPGARGPQARTGDRRGCRRDPRACTPPSSAERVTGEGPGRLLGQRVSAAGRRRCQGAGGGGKVPPDATSAGKCASHKGTHRTASL